MAIDDADRADDLEVGRLMAEAAIGHLTAEEPATVDTDSWFDGYAAPWADLIAAPVRAGAQLASRPAGESSASPSQAGSEAVPKGA